MHKTAARRSPGKRKENDGYIPLKVRFHAWWEGVAPQVILRRTRRRAGSPKNAVIEVDKAGPSEAEAKKQYYDWSLDRADLNNRIWGEGFMWPGGPEYAVDLVKPAGVDPAQSILDLAAGLGGGTRAVAEAFGMWVDGMERNSKLAEHANRISFERDMKGRARVETYDPANLELRPGRYHCVFARESFFLVEDKVKLFSEVHKSLKDSGHFIFTDYMLAGGTNPNALKDWARGEPESIHLRQPDHYRQLLNKLNFDIRIFQDDSDRLRQKVVYRMKEFVEELDSAEFDRKLVTSLMREAELWRSRLITIQAGDLRYMRVHAIKKRPKL